MDFFLWNEKEKNHIAPFRFPNIECSNRENRRHYYHKNWLQSLFVRLFAWYFFFVCHWISSRQTNISVALTCARARFISIVNRWVCFFIPSSIECWLFAHLRCIELLTFSIHLYQDINLHERTQTHCKPIIFSWNLFVGTAFFSLVRRCDVAEHSTAYFTFYYNQPCSTGTHCVCTHPVRMGETKYSNLSLPALMSY